MINDEIYAAVNSLTESYNAAVQEVQQLRDGLKKQKTRADIPLYKNGQIICDGRNNFEMTEEPYTHLLTVGKAQITKYGAWNGRHIVKVTNTTKITNCETGILIDYVVFKVKLPDANGSFFLLTTNADSYDHGHKMAWMCDKTKTLHTFLGAAVPDKYKDYGRQVVLNPHNSNGWDAKHYQWISFNVNKEDIIKDDDGYSYIAVTSDVATWYIGGWAVAERNTHFLWTAGRILDKRFYGGAGSIHVSQEFYLSYSKFDNNKQYSDIRLPYSHEDDILIGFLVYDKYGMCPVDVTAHNTQESFHFTNIMQGNVPCVRGAIWGYRWDFLRIPKEVVTKNTIELTGLKCLRLDFHLPACETNFYYCGFFTETC